jgi:hypothetical protein
MKISAAVIEISKDTPKQSDTFFVDTQVWHWLTYCQHLGRKTLPSRVQEYINYINKIGAEKATLRRCGLSLAELANVIEKDEREVFNELQRKCNRTLVDEKEYRHDYPDERQKVQKSIRISWEAVKRYSSPTSVALSERLTNNVLNLLCSCSIGSYDSLLTESMRVSRIVQIITDDKDFATIPGIQVFTNNREVIKEADNQNMLRRRKS